MYNLPELEWNAPYARGAWIIPLNGPAVVSEGSSASVIDECGHVLVSSSGVSGSSEESAERQCPIHWSPNAVRAAWNTLRMVRKNNAMGSIGLHFEYDEDDRKDLTHPRRSNTPRIGSNSPSSHSYHGSTKAHVRRNEWIKLCCDGRYALRIRTVLAQLKANDNLDVRDRRTIGQAGPAERTKSRRKVLEGAKLVYVDELGNPILIA